jgi:hypothetical protein
VLSLGVEVCAVDGLDVFAERAWICVAFGAAWCFADVGFLWENSLEFRQLPRYS